MWLPLLAITTFAILLESISAFPSSGILKIRSVSTGPEESITHLDLKTSSSESSVIHSTSPQQRDLQLKESSHDVTQNDIDYVTKNPLRIFENQLDLDLCESGTDASSNHRCSHSNSCKDDSAEIKSKDGIFIARFFYNLVESFLGLTRTLRNWDSIKTADITPVGLTGQPKCSSWLSCTTTPEYAQNFPKNGLKRRQSTDKTKGGNVQESFPLPIPQNPPKANAVAPGSFVLPTPKNPSNPNTVAPGSVPLPFPPPNLGVGTSKTKQRFHRLPSPADAAFVGRNGRKSKQPSTAQTISTVNGKKIIGHPLSPPPQNLRAATNINRKAFSVPPSQIGGSNFRSANPISIPVS